MSITKIAIKRPTIIVVIFSALALLGLVSFTNLKYELFGKMDIPVLAITTVYPGAAASEVETSVTKKIEDAISSLENVKSIRSSSLEGASIVVIELVSNSDVNIALQDAQRKVNAILSTLPDNVKTPALNKFSMDDLPIINMGVTGNLPPTQLYLLTKEQIKSRLSKLEGVGQISLLGGNEREIQVRINRDKLNSYKLPVSLVYAAIGNANLEYPTGKIENDVKEYTVRLSGKLKSLDDLSNIVVYKSPTGSIVKLSDVAEIVDGVAEQTTLNRINQNNSIGLIVQKQSDANAVEVSKLMKQEIKNIEKDYAKYGVKFEIANDNSEYTLAASNAVVEDLLYAVILVAIVMFLFLHSIRNSFIVMVSIPASIISVFLMMYVFNFSLNLMTLLALSLVVGILVDDSIVVLENIHRHLEMGKNKQDAALDGREEIGFTAVAITMVDVVVFLPLALVGGMIGNILREFSLVVVFSTLMSLFVSFTLTPLLASRISKIERFTRGTLMGKLALGFEDLYNKIVAHYEKILLWGLHHKKTVFLSVTGLIIAAIALIPGGFIGTEFISQGDKGEFVVKLEGEPQNTLYKTNMLTEQVENMLMKKPEVTKIFSNVGYSSSSAFAGVGEANKSEITVTIVPKQQRKMTVDEYAEMVKKEVSQIPGIKVSSAPVSITGTANEAPIQVLLRSTDTEKMYKVADKVMAIMKTIPGATDVKLSVDKSKPELQIKLNRDKMSILGLSVNDVGTTLNLAFAGNTDLQYLDNGYDYNIKVSLDDFNRQKVEDVGSLTFMNSKGQPVELKQFADIFQSLGPNKLERYDRLSSLMVNANVLGRPVGTVGEEIKQAVKKNLGPTDVDIQYKGQLERQNEAFGSLGLALLAAIILVYLVMVALYNSYLHPFVVLFSIPVAIIGALLALALAKQTISIFSLVGLIMLIGLVAKNAILLVDFTNKLRADGLEIIDALVAAGKERLRPILMTTLAMVFGMIPIALATGEASEIKNGMAWVIIGGLSSSLLFTLVLVPSVYLTMETWKSKLSRKSKSKAKSEEIESVEVLQD